MKKVVIKTTILRTYYVPDSVPTDSVKNFWEELEKRKINVLGEGMFPEVYEPITETEQEEIIYVKKSMMKNFSKS